MSLTLRPGARSRSRPRLGQCALTHPPRRRASPASPSTLRYYEREGILPDVARTAGGRRAYTEADLSTLRFLQCLRDTGMSILLLRRYGQLCQDDSTLPERVALLEEHARIVADQIATLQTQQAKVHSKLDWYRSELDRRKHQPN